MSLRRGSLHLLTILYIAIHEYMHDSGRHMRPSDYGIRSSAATSAVISPLGVTCDPKGIGACLCVRLRAWRHLVSQLTPTYTCDISYFDYD